MICGSYGWYLQAQKQYISISQFTSDMGRPDDRTTDDTPELLGNKCWDNWITGPNKLYNIVQPHIASWKRDAGNDIVDI